MSQDSTSGPIGAHLQTSLATLEPTQGNAPVLSSARRIAISEAPALQAFKKPPIVGNDGNAADLLHLASEIVGRDIQERGAYSVIALTIDTFAQAAIRNDHDVEHAFARKVEGLGQSRDVLLALTTSGRPPLSALKEARELCLVTIGFAGIKGHASESPCNDLLVVAGEDTDIIELLYLIFAHGLYDEVERAIMRRTAARGSSRK